MHHKTLQDGPQINCSSGMLEVEVGKRASFCNDKFKFRTNIYETQKNQVALTGIRTTDLWIASPYQLSYRGSLILCEFFYTIFGDQLIILTSFPYMSGISPFHTRFEQVKFTMS
jgi:hypothetical protein